MWCKIVAVCCFVWPPSLQLCLGQENWHAGRQKIEFGYHLKLNIWVSVSILFFNAVFDLDKLILFCESDFHCVRCL